MQQTQPASLRLHRGSWGKYARNDEGLAIFVPTFKPFADLRVLDVYSEGSFTAHWRTNWNENGDFLSELRTFSPDMVEIDTTEQRNAVRRMAGLPIITPSKERWYACSRCATRKLIETNHFLECYSLGRHNTCPSCPPYAKYPEYGGTTIWIPLQVSDNDTEEEIEAVYSKLNRK